jgi:hypothetical protein
LDDIEDEVKGIREKNEKLKMKCSNINLEKKKLDKENKKMIKKL